jgi:hypothetical protein
MDQSALARPAALPDREHELERVRPGWAPSPIRIGLSRTAFEEPDAFLIVLAPEQRDG